MNKLFFAFIVLSIFLLGSCSPERIELGPEWAKQYAQKFKDTGNGGYKPEDGYVPDEETAINIAVAVWKKIYKESSIEKQKPYFAYLVDDLWVVTGSLPWTYAGGTAKAIIDKKSGEILHIMHYK